MVLSYLQRFRLEVFSRSLTVAVAAPRA